MMRVIQPELLDELPSSEPQAQRSRRDLRRVNAWMGNARTVARVLATAGGLSRVVELGAGDGTFLLAVARRLAISGKTVEATLIDRQKLVSAETLTSFRNLGWSVSIITSDALDWLTTNTDGTDDVLLANLFLHHFTEDQLRSLLALAAQRARCIVACEPARRRRTLVGVRLLPLIGCNGVTRHDALISVCAGFTGRELSALWPNKPGWKLHEGPSGICSHLFVARRTS